MEVSTRFGYAAPAADDVSFYEELDEQFDFDGHIDDYESSVSSCSDAWMDDEGQQGECFDDGLDDCPDERIEGDSDCDSSSCSSGSSVGEEEEEEAAAAPLVRVHKTGSGLTIQRNSSDGKPGLTLLSCATEVLRCRFPFQSISVRLSDMFCLQDGDQLNDTLVDFYLNHVAEHLLPDEPGRRVTVLPAVFWHNLSIQQAALPEHIDHLTTQQQLDARFSDVLDFLSDFELVEVDYVVIPVNEWEHWSLAVVCHPFSPEGRIVYLDSQLDADWNNLQQTTESVDQFMRYAYSRVRGVECDYHLASCIPDRLPQQDTQHEPTDSGVYMLEYARRFLMHPVHKLDSFDFSAAYTDFSVLGKRREMQQSILSLCTNRQVWQPLLELLDAAAKQRRV